jgi:predicted nucleic acid-binding protein
LILIDTSAWVAFFRNEGPATAIVDRALEDDEAGLCGPVLAELRRGFRSASERQRTLPLFEGCHQLPPPRDLWHDAGDLGFALARKGAIVKTLDLLIATYALANSVPILTLDKDFRLIARAGTGLHLVEV